MKRLNHTFLWVVLFSFGMAGRGFATAQSEKKESIVLLGIDVLKDDHFSVLTGKQIGLVTNQTGVDSSGRSTADILMQAPQVKLVALFSPEHGIRGEVEAGQKINDALDPVTHLPVYSLYGVTSKPTPEMLNALDALVFDMQDVGTRFYTYLSTMGKAMEAAAERGIEFIVLDRPNPLGGEILEGAVLDLRYRHFTAYYAVPVRHAMTAGEIATWYNQTHHLHLNLKVVPMKHWTRNQFWDDTGLPFVPPSPNIRNPREALLYIGLGMFEATNVSCGRGTLFPFERIGAPWMNGSVLAQRLNALGLAGVQFRPVYFTPSKELYQGQLCQGVSLQVTHKLEIRPVDIFVQTACLLRELHPKEFQLRWDEVARVTGSREFEKRYKANASAQEILTVFRKSIEQFQKDRQKYLLY